MNQEINEGTISKALHKKFETQFYQLSNAYVFSWESDFFSVSKEKYCQEIEIKISKADFFNDFEKQKHKIFQASIEEKEIIFISHGQGVGEKICEYKTASLQSPYFHSFRDKTHQQKYHYEHHDYLDGFRWFRLQERIEVAYAPATKIKPIYLQKTLYPHKFWYCAPESLAQEILQHIPDYAGLLQFSFDLKGRESIDVLKKAPFIHKRKMELNKILLDKFYYRNKELLKELNAYKKYYNERHDAPSI